MANAKPISNGAVFGRLVVLQENGKIAHENAYLCLCACGNQKVIRRGHLNGGKIKSCGCLQKEVRGRSRITHGKSESPIYGLWRTMIDRCENKKSKTYPRYGALGVSVCDRWQTFENFYADMGDRPDGRSLDRINPYGNYEPGNCRWATAIEQRHNRRK